MSKEKLKKAREFEQEQLKRISPEERPCYHVTGGSGWINDPNGSMIQMDSPFIKMNIICFISIIRILMNGDRCTGDM